MVFNLKEFDIPVNVTRIANVHYFEFINKYHTLADSHNFYEIVYVDKGVVKIIADNYSGELCDGELIIHRPLEHHALECAGEIPPDVIIIGFECNCSQLDMFSEKPFSLTPELKKALAETVNEGMLVYEPPYDIPNLLDMQKREAFPFGTDQMLKLKLEIFLIGLIRNFQNIDSHEAISYDANKLNNVHRYISEHYREKITLDNICFLFGINKTTLCQNFKAEYGITILNYINSLKIKEAKKLLRENELSVTEISEQLGFGSIHYFCRFFKKCTGKSPKTYMDTLRSKLNM